MQYLQGPIYIEIILCYIQINITFSGTQYDRYAKNYLINFKSSKQSDDLILMDGLLVRISSDSLTTAVRLVVGRLSDGLLTTMASSDLLAFLYQLSRLAFCRPSARRPSGLGQLFSQLFSSLTAATLQGGAGDDATRSNLGRGCKIFCSWNYLVLALAHPLLLLVCYLYTPANRSDVLALVRTHFMYLASVGSLHPSSINHTDAHTSSDYDPEASDRTNLTV